MSRRLTRALGVLLVLGIVLVAAFAGVSDDSTGPTSSTTTSWVVPPGSAGAWAVGPSDLPEGWSEAQVDLEATSDPAACGVDVGDPAVVTERVAVAYDAPAGTEANLASSGLRVADPELAADLVDRVERGEVGACLAERIESSFEGSGIEVRDLEVTSAALDPAAATGVTGATTTLTYELVVNGDPAAITQEQVVLVAGDRVAVLELTGGADPFPPDLRDQVVATVTTRIAT